MADNFLENRMEAYRSGRLSRQSRSTPAMRRPQRPDTFSLVYPEMAVAIIAPTFTAGLSETVAALRSVGAKVAFTCQSPEGNAASLLAQRTGSRYYPQSAVPTRERFVGDVRDTWKHLDFIVTVNSRSALIERADGSLSRCVSLPAEAAPEAAARLILFLLHPLNVSLL
ncbi:MAG: hypothetical protein HDS40_01200 [Bacteroides sp.]|nr:hypothetical protein [Bacteroides sp.]